MKYLFTSTYDRATNHIIIEIDNIESLKPVIVNELKEAIDDQDFDPDDSDTYEYAGDKGTDWDFEMHDDSIDAWYNRNDGDSFDWMIEAIDSIPEKSLSGLING